MYIAPSWSWASASFALRDDDVDLDIFGHSDIGVLETKLVPAGSSEKGASLSGLPGVSARVKLLESVADGEKACGPEEKLLRICRRKVQDDKRWIYWARQVDFEHDEEAVAWEVVGEDLEGVCREESVDILGLNTAEDQGVPWTKTTAWAGGCCGCCCLHFGDLRRLYCTGWSSRGIRTGKVVPCPCL